MSANRVRWLRLVPGPARPGRALALLAAGTVAGVALAAVHMGATPALAAPTMVTFTFTGASPRHLLEFEGKSYRLKEAAGRLTGLVKQGESKNDLTEAA